MLVLQFRQLSTIISLFSLFSMDIPCRARCLLLLPFLCSRCSAQLEARCRTRSCPCSSCSRSRPKAVFHHFYFVDVFQLFFKSLFNCLFVYLFRNWFYFNSSRSIRSDWILNTNFIRIYVIVLVIQNSLTWLNIN